MVRKKQTHAMDYAVDEIKMAKCRLPEGSLMSLQAI
jgi:hypothetical protein